jgi:aldose 1-epimerase
MSIVRSAFGVTSAGVAIDRYVLTAGDVEAEVITYGGTLIALRSPDRNGNQADVLLGFDTLTPYLGAHPFFGSLVGRFGNRIAGGRFTLNDIAYVLAQNNGPNHLHGGPGGFHQVVWEAHEHTSPDGPAVALRYVSADGEEGYPGTLTVTVVYILTAQGALRIDYTASTDRDTVVNLTNHAYFNLTGSGDILDHEMQIAAARFVPVDATLIPTGELRPVADTPMDFRTPARIGAWISDDDGQIGSVRGYDHTWVLDHEAGTLGLAAYVYDPASGRTLTTHTTQPGVQFYTANFQEAHIVGKGGQIYDRRNGFCLETQHFPDSPNQPQFPSTLLRPGETYAHTTIYQLGVKG